MFESLSLKDLVIFGFIFEITSAIFLASDIFHSKEKVLTESQEESHPRFGPNPFYIKKRRNIKIGMFFA